MDYRWRSMVVVVVLLLGFAVPRWLHGNVACSLPSPRIDRNQIGNALV